MKMLSLITHAHSVPILDFWGPYAKTVSPAGGVGRKEWMKRICPCFTQSRPQKALEKRYLFRGSGFLFIYV